MLALDVRANPALRVLGLWCVGAVTITAVILSLIASQGALPFYRLSRHGVVTQGTVTGFEPENHRTVHYTYEVDGRFYSAAQQGGAGRGNRDFEYLTVGDSVQVYYLPEDPGLRCLGNPRAGLANELIPLALAIVLGPLFIIIVNVYKYPGFRNWLLTR